MDLEEYYDSLDEDSNYGSLVSLEEPKFKKDPEKCKRESKIPVKIKDLSPDKEVGANFRQADDVVPFYDQYLSKTDVDLKKMFFRNLPNRKTKKKRPPVANINGKLKSNSYLHLFYAKNGLDRTDLTNRATCRDLTPKSCDVCGDYELASFTDSSDSESVHSCNNFLNEEDKLSLSVTSLDSKLFSVSQRNLKGRLNRNLNRNHNKPRTMQLPELGSLGPEIPKEKLDLLKKRQEYGQKVSQKNKIKMIEKKLLKNLRQEIQECKKVV